MHRLASEDYQDGSRQLVNPDKMDWTSLVASNLQPHHRTRVVLSAPLARARGYAPKQRGGT